MSYVYIHDGSGKGWGDDSEPNLSSDSFDDLLGYSISRLQRISDTSETVVGESSTIPTFSLLLPTRFALRVAVNPSVPSAISRRS